MSLDATKPAEPLGEQIDGAGRFHRGWRVPAAVAAVIAVIAGVLWVAGPWRGRSTGESAASTPTAPSSAVSSPGGEALALPAGYDVGVTNPLTLPTAVLPGALTSATRFMVWQVVDETGSGPVWGVSARLDRYAMSPAYPAPTDRAGTVRLLTTLAPLGGMGSGPSRVWQVGDVLVMRMHTGWLDTFVWVDSPRRYAYVLTEGFNQHSQTQWEDFVNAFVAHQNLG